MLGHRVHPASHARRKTDLSTGIQRAAKCLIYMVRREGFEPPSPSHLDGLHAVHRHAHTIYSLIARRSPSGSKPATGLSKNRGLGDSERE